jgi:hypothetical protein
MSTRSSLSSERLAEIAESCGDVGAVRYPSEDQIRTCGVIEIGTASGILVATP